MADDNKIRLYVSSYELEEISNCSALSSKLRIKAAKSLATISIKSELVPGGFAGFELDTEETFCKSLESKVLINNYIPTDEEKQRYFNKRGYYL
jgi:hypothetical protein